jgi:Zn-dependent protease with chaperone function
VSAKVGHCTQKAIQFFQKLKNEVAASTENSLFSRLKLAFFEFFDGHPPMTERIKYLEPIAQEQAAH